MKKIKIVSDGQGRNTHVYTHDGAEITGITQIDINITANAFVTADLKFENVELEIEAEIKSERKSKGVNGKLKMVHENRICIKNELTYQELLEGDYIRRVDTENEFNTIKNFIIQYLHCTRSLDLPFLLKSIIEEMRLITFKDYYKNHPLKKWANEKTGH